MHQSNNLRSWRESRGLSLEKLAKAVGSQAPNLYRIEVGTQQPRVKLLTAICAYFGRTQAEFYATAEPSDTTSVGVYRVPVYEYAQPCSEDLSPETSTTFLLTEVDYPAGSYGLKIATEENAPLYTPGDVVIVAPRIPEPLDMVVACVRGKRLLRQYRVTDPISESYELAALRDGFGVIASNILGVTIQGVVVEHRKFPRIRK